MDLATAQANLDRWLAVEAALASGQSYQLGELGVVRVDARTVRSQVSYWARIVADYTARAAGSNGSAASLASFS